MRFLKMSEFLLIGLMFGPGLSEAYAQNDPPPCEPGPWQSGIPMPVGRVNTGAAKDNQGRIYIPGGGAYIGGVNVASPQVIRFDEGANQWDLIADLNIPRSGAAVSSDQSGRIYTIGGHDGVSYLASVEVYDPAQPEQGWAFAEPLPSARGGAPRTVADSAGNIYLVGGHDNTHTFRSVLMFDPDQPELGWLHHSDMLEARAAFGLAIDSQDRIYAIGGVNYSGVHTSTAERFDLTEGTWSYIDSLNSARMVGVGVADSCDSIYAIGGWEPGFTCKVERYNPTTEMWEDFNAINHCRNNMAGILGDSGRLYAFGGDGPQTTVEFFETCVCEPPEDSDGDGVPDEEDDCPNSDLSPTIVIDGCDTEVVNQLFPGGCTMADLIGQCADAAVNNAVFVCCVAHMTNEWKQEGVISGAEKGPIQSCAAQADIP